MSKKIDYTKWECMRCSRIVDATKDDYCPVCGESLPSEAAAAEKKKKEDEEHLALMNMINTVITCSY